MDGGPSRRGESRVAALAGGLFGLLLATVGIRLFVAFGPAYIPRIGEVTIDLRVLLFTLLVLKNHQQVSCGFRTDRLLAVKTPLPGSKYPELHQSEAFLHAHRVVAGAGRPGRQPSPRPEGDQDRSCRGLAM